MPLRFSATLTWNNNGDFDFSGGYQVRYGTVSETYDTTITADMTACSVKNCEYNLEGLTNDTTYYLVVDSLKSDGTVAATSCEVDADPHVVAFNPDMQINPADGGTAQETPAIAHGWWEGAPLFMAWVESGKVLLTRSNNQGGLWETPEQVLMTVEVEAAPSLAFRPYVPQTDPDTGEPLIEIPPALFIVLQSGTDVVLVRADFPDGPDGAHVLDDTPVTVGQGLFPAVDAVGDHIEVAFEDANGAIQVASSNDGGATFSSLQRVDNGDIAGTGDTSSKPSLAIDPETHNVYVAYHGNRAAGDSDIYRNVSTDVGASYLAKEIRIDDDAGGGIQSNVSLAVDHRTGAVMATWEDRRSAADIYFSRSTDYGANWDANIQVGAGLTGDQTQPRAVADPGRNIYVAFIDSTAGIKPMFSRFNADGAFDPALSVSTEAGAEGVTAEDPAVAIDEYGNIYTAWTENRDGANRDVFFALGY